MLSFAILCIVLIAIAIKGIENYFYGDDKLLNTNNEIEVPPVPETPKLELEP